MRYKKQSTKKKKIVEHQALKSPKRGPHRMILRHRLVLAFNVTLKNTPLEFFHNLIADNVAPTISMKIESTHLSFKKEYELYNVKGIIHNFLRCNNQSIIF